MKKSNDSFVIKSVVMPFTEVWSTALKTQVLDEVKKDGFALKQYPQFSNDKGIVLAAVRENCFVIQYASKGTQNDFDVFASAVLGLYESIYSFGDVQDIDTILYRIKTCEDAINVLVCNDDTVDLSLRHAYVTKTILSSIRKAIFEKNKGLDNLNVEMVDLMKEIEDLKGETQDFQMENEQLEGNLSTLVGEVSRIKSKVHGFR